MMRPLIIAPSILSADFSRLGEEVQAVFGREGQRLVCQQAAEAKTVRDGADRNVVHGPTNCCDTVRPDGRDGYGTARAGKNREFTTL